MKKTMLTLLLAILTPIVLMATGGGDSGSSAEGAGTTRISAVFDRILLEANGQKEWAAAFGELTGVQIDIVKPEHNQYRQILGASIAAGDLPDVVELQTADIVPYAQAGLLVPLDDFIKASPHYKDLNKDFIEAYRMKDGHIYGFPQTDADGCVTYIRKDWLDKVGLQAPKTYNEFVAVLRAFVKNDPDGNGKADTIGMTLPFNTGWEFDYYNRMIMQDAMFGFIEKNGKWNDGFLDPSMKAALQRFQDLYKEGLLDNEFFTNQTSAARTKVFEGQAGVMEYWMGTWATRFDSSAKAANPKAVVVPIPPIRNAYYVKRIVPVNAITTAADNPAAVFDAVINTMLDKGAGQMLFTLGIEGMHYKMEGGKAVMLPEPANPERPFDKSFNSPYLIMNGWQVPLQLAALDLQAGEILNEYSKPLSLMEGGETYTKHAGELLALKQEVFSKVVVGDYGVDEGLAIYKQKAAALEIDAVIAELNN